jgi:outer membrane protein TolC
MKNVCSLIILFFLSFYIYSQNTVTIDECQQWAVSHSSANVQKSLNAELLKVKLTDVSSHLYPTLEINGHASYQSDVITFPEGISNLTPLSKDQYNISLDFAQNVFYGGKMFFGRKYERLLNKEEIYKLDLSINEIKEQVISIYLNLLIVEKQINILSSVESTINEQLDQLRVLLKEGVVYGNPVAQLELEKLKIEQQKGDLKATKESLVASLAIVTGKDLSNVSFVVPPEPATDNNLSSYRLEFDIFQNQQAALDYQRKLHFSRSLPKLSIFATGGYGRPTYDILSNQFDWYYMVGVRLNIPLIDWAKTSGVGNIINLQKSILSAKETDFERANKVQIQEKLNEIRRIEDLLVLDKQIAEKQIEITKTFKTQLLNGTITAFDYIKQQNDELQSLINQEVHSIQLLKAKYELLALKGKL